MTSLAPLPAAAANASPLAGPPLTGEFVDLYALLGAAPDTPTEQLRARISALYLEAQHNLDHHNFRKRFYYQQLFEVHLPQAYECLLDDPRRAHYDACLNASRKGEPFPPAPALHIQHGDPMLPTVGDAPVTESLFLEDTETSEEKSHQEFVASLAPLSTTTEALKPSPPAGQHLAQPEAMINESELERRRDHKRRELIKSEVHTASWAWGSVGGAAVVGASFILLAQWVPLMQRTLAPAGRGGPSPAVLWVLGLLLSALVAGAAFMVTARVVRRIVINKLSQMPYEELLRRCAQ